MERTKLLQQIYAELGKLEDNREEAYLKGYPFSIIHEIDKEMKALRLKAQIIINSPCPIIIGK